MSYDYRRPSPRFPLLAVLLPLLFLVAVIIGAGWWLWHHRESGIDVTAQPRPVAARGELMAEEQTSIQIYERASPAVVHVTNFTERRQFSLDVTRIPKGTGSGIVWDTEGHIVTNNHVVAGADAVKVTLADHSTYEAQQIWVYPPKDIAVIWINAPASKLHPLLIGTSHDLKVGQATYAIGNPFGLDQTMTTGIVSALGREIATEDGHPIQGVIQTSAPINPGNSGGPLLDSAGRLIGMNTAIISPSGGSAGIGFAIPVDEINEYVPQLIRHGKVVRPRLGVQIAEDQVAQKLGVTEGALILRVTKDSPADKAGLQATHRGDAGNVVLGDVIVAFDGKSVSKAKDLFAALEKHKPGDSVTLTIIREEKRRDVSVTLLEQP
jgi:S1-C subfamily serine protease